MGWERTACTPCPSKEYPSNLCSQTSGRTHRLRFLPDPLFLHKPHKLRMAGEAALRVVNDKEGIPCFIVFTLI